MPTWVAVAVALALDRSDDGGYAQDELSVPAPAEGSS